MQWQHVVALMAVAFALVKVFGPIGAALAERIRGRAQPAADAALAADMDHLRGRLAEVEERLDFAERLLAQAREADQLPGGAHR
jgi:Tfp pilus assembly protein PilO